MSVDTRAHALIHYGSKRCWPKGEPHYDLGTVFDLCSWNTWDATEATRTIRVWRNPDVSKGDLWWEPSRFGTIREWQAAKAKDPLSQLANDLAAIRTPLRVPWGSGWRGDQGTTDNGIIINLAPGESYNILGLRKASFFDLLAINARALGIVAKDGDYVCDSITHRRADTSPHGSQGPKWKNDGLLTPAHFQRLIPGELRLVIFNSQYGPDAKAAPGGWVEHKAPKLPYTTSVPRPAGDHPTMIPCYQPFHFDITDAEIETWLTNEIPAHMRDGQRWYARNLRGYEQDADRPRTPRPTIRTAESGTGDKLIESVGWHNPKAKTEWAKCGIKTKSDVSKIGRNILAYGRVVAL